MRLLSDLTGFSAPDMAVDLGTANTLVYVRGQGIVVFEPSVVAIDERTGAVYAAGIEAKRMLGRTPAHITATRPLRHGVIHDFEVTGQMLRYFVRKANPNRLSQPRIVICVPSGLTGVERRAVIEATVSAGARRAFLIEEPMAAAIGAGLPVAEPAGNMIVDVGGGTSEMAVVALGGMVVSQSIRVGSDDFDEAIAAHVRREHKLAIGTGTAEEIKLELGSAGPLPDEIEAEIRGRDLVSGLPKTVLLRSEDVRQAMAEPVAAIVEAVKTTLEQTPPELAADVMDQGIMLAGGGCMLRGFDARLRAETELPVHLAESPLTCVAVGAGRSLEELSAMSRTASSSPRQRRRR